MDILKTIKELSANIRHLEKIKNETEAHRDRQRDRINTAAEKKMKKIRTRAEKRLNVIEEKVAAPLSRVSERIEALEDALNGYKDGMRIARTREQKCVIEPAEGLSSNDAVLDIVKYSFIQMHAIIRYPGRFCRSRSTKLILDVRTQQNPHVESFVRKSLYGTTISYPRKSLVNRRFRTQEELIAWYDKLKAKILIPILALEAKMCQLANKYAGVVVGCDLRLTWCPYAREKVLSLGKTKVVFVFTAGEYEGVTVTVTHFKDNVFKVSYTGSTTKFNVDKDDLMYTVERHLKEGFLFYDQPSIIYTKE